MADMTHLFGGSFIPPSIEQRTPEEQLIDAIHNAGLEPPSRIIMDGKVHRFFSGRNRKRGKTGWYVIFGDNIPAGQFGCWRSGLQVTWRADIGRKITEEERQQNDLRIEEAKRKREEEELERNRKAQREISEIWRNAQAASQEHPYLKTKNVMPHGARVGSDGRLILPLYQSDGTLSSLQYISHSGEKLYHKGGRVGSCFWMLGTTDEHGDIYIAEGFATAATIHEHTKRPVVVSYSASNLVPTTGIIREMFDSSKIIIVADNDESGVGMRYAEQAAAKFGAGIVMPPTKGDANDYIAAGGDLNDILISRKDEWLIHIDEFCCKPTPIKWLVRHWVQSESLIMVHGPSGGGKTFLVLDWCMRIGCGISDWIGKKVNPGSVVYLAGEGHHGLKGRAVAWMQEHGITGGGNIHFSKNGTEINTAHGYLKVLNSIRELKTQPDLIVIDTLHRFLEGDENLAKDVKTMLDACNSLMREFRCSVLLVHHTGVSQEAQHRARGSSAWRGALDIEISVIPKGNGAIQVTQMKSKDFELAESLYVESKKIDIEGWFDDESEPVTSCIVVEGQSPAVEKRPPKINEYISDLRNCWNSSGGELDENENPYITRASLKNYLTEVLKMKEKAVYNSCTPSDRNRIIGALTLAGIVRPAMEGWIVCCENVASQFKLQAD